MENEEGIGEGLIPVSVDLGMHDGDSWVPVPEEGANQEWSIPVTAASPIEEESNANSTLVSQEIENEEGEEYWEYEIGQKPRKPNEEDMEKDENERIGNGEEEEEEEELEERYELEIEQSVADFVDEEFIGRNTIPESEDEDEDEFYPRDRKRKRTEDKLDVGTSFFSGFEFKEAVLHYALSKGRNIEQRK